MINEKEKKHAISIDDKYLFFMVTTPRHWWVAHTIALFLNKSAILCIFDSFNGAKKLYEISKECSNGIFSEVFLAPGSLSGLDKGWAVNKTYKKFEWYLVKKFLNQIIAKFKISEVFTGNLSSSQTQYIYFKLKNNAEYHVIDDGLVAYRREYTKPKRGLSLLHARITHGFKIQDPDMDTILPFYRYGWFYSPEIVHERFNNLVLKKIENKWLDVSVVNDLKNEIYNKFSLNRSKWNNPKIVFVFSNLSYLESDCPDFNKNQFELNLVRFVNDLMVSNSITNQYKIWVKYHPRELDDDVFRMRKKFGNINFVPNGLPFEFLIDEFLSGDHIVGELSTVLFDAATRRKDINVWSIGCISKPTVESNLFKKSGVKIYN